MSAVIVKTNDRVGPSLVEEGRRRRVAVVCENFTWSCLAVHHGDECRPILRERILQRMTQNKNRVKQLDTDLAKIEIGNADAEKVSISRLHQNGGSKRAYLCRRYKVSVKTSGNSSPRFSQVHSS